MKKSSSFWNTFFFCNTEKARKEKLLISIYKSQSKQLVSCRPSLSLDEVSSLKERPIRNSVWGDNINWKKYLKFSFLSQTQSQK